MKTPKTAYGIQLNPTVINNWIGDIKTFILYLIIKQEEEREEHKPKSD